MFGNVTFMITAAAQLPRVPPKDVPPPTPVNLPRCCPQAHEHDGSNDAEPPSDEPAKPLPALLQGIVRPTEVSISHLEAVGVHVVPDAAPAQLIPDPACIPDFDAWHALSSEEAHATNESTRKRLNNGNLSAGCQTYLDRRRELSIPNEAAYRTIRRIPPPKGQAQARLGNSYEFYRNLELYSAFWEDTSKPVPSESKSADQAGETTGAGEHANTEGGKGAEGDSAATDFYRTGAGNQMPADYRQNMVTAFLKLVTYDFGCNVSAPRTEPRLHITSRSSSGSTRSSYFTSGCTFIFRSPTTREAARVGIVEGPLAAVSARHVTSFPPAGSPGTDRDSVLDLSRELVAALITAQHRAREGRTEKRFGENAWWTTKPRWGGGPGGPIGREVEMLSGADQTIGDKDAPPSENQQTGQPSSATSPSASSKGTTNAMALPQRPSTRPPGSSSDAASSSKGTKRLKKSGNHPMYDNYRMVRPPAPTWDKKTKYQAIGRARGADYDDVFVVSSLFHHISILRVRVPDRLLAVLEGEGAVEDGAKGGRRRSWGRLEVWRSPWFDFFQIEDRIKAMQLVWSMMAYMMREVKEDGTGEQAKQGDGDVAMTGA